MGLELGTKEPNNMSLLFCHDQQEQPCSAVLFFVYFCEVFCGAFWLVSWGFFFV